MAERIAEGIYKINVDSNVYFLDIGIPTVIDAGPRQYREQVKIELSEIIPLDKIKRVIFTHLHHDHMGNFDLFPNAEYFASPEEIESLHDDPVGTILDPELAGQFKVELHPLVSLEGFDLIKTPGHTKGSFCLLHKKTKVLFSGDTKFYNGVGRVDLPSSVPEHMLDSQKKIIDLDFEILAPGHDY